MECRKQRAGAVALTLVMLLALTGCIGRPGPTIPPAAGTQKVLLFGDSLLSQAASRIGPNLAFSGVSAEIVDRTAPGAGLLAPGIVDDLTADLDANADADIVVVGFAGDCPSCPVTPGGAEFYGDWFAAAQDLVDAILARGMNVVWVVPPPIEPGLPGAAVPLGLAERGLAFAQDRQLTVANWTDALTDIFGNYQSDLLYEKLFEPAAWHTVRLLGIFLTEEGSQRAANWTAAAIRQAWDLPPPPPSQPPTTLQVVTTPRSFPDFSPDVTDYVVRCTGDPIRVRVGAPDGTTVSVAGQPAAGGWFTVAVTRSTGQALHVAVQSPSQPQADYVLRCLPLDFPEWTTSRSGPTQAEYYVTVPWTSDPVGSYAAIFDTNGVPVWWAPKTFTLFADLFDNGNVGLTVRGGGPGQEIELDGTPVASIKPPNGVADEHDFLRLDNGNYVMVGNVLVPNVDFSSWGRGTGTLIDHVIQELTPDGDVVWSWVASDHIPVTETGSQWRSPNLAGVFDAYHWNSIDATETGFLVSFRHLNAIYAIDKATGNIAWKLGGSTTPQSLSIANDPVGSDHLVGPHDARMLADGSATIHDNGTGVRPPRGVRFQVDAAAHTATWLESVGDAIVPSAGCCGSARRLSGGNWVFGWGGSNTVTENTSAGSRVFLMQFGSGARIYRAVPVAPGVLDRAELRAGMDAQHP